MGPAGCIELHHAGVRNWRIASRRDTGHLQDVQEHSGHKVSCLHIVRAWLLRCPFHLQTCHLRCLPLPSWPVHCRHYLQHGLQTRLADNIASICRDPQCQNGGILNAKNTSDTLHCATCSCPDGWRGADCSLCERVDVCPSRQGDKGARLHFRPHSPCAGAVVEASGTDWGLHRSRRCAARGWPHSCLSDKQILGAI